jgi:hypothetical protein
MAPDLWEVIMDPRCLRWSWTRRWLQCFLDSASSGIKISCDSIQVTLFHQRLRASINIHTISYTMNSVWRCPIPAYVKQASPLQAYIIDANAFTVEFKVVPRVGGQGPVRA